MLDGLQAALAAWLLSLPLTVWLAAGILLLALIAVVSTVLVLRADHRRPRDPQRLYDAEQRRIMRDRAGHRCEHNGPLAPRCSGSADEADHIHPWSRGGATSLENGQYLCRRHNNSKSNWKPTGLYIWRLQRRRLDYFPAGCEIRIWRFYGTPPPWV